MKVVVDTSTAFSALVFGGKPLAVLNAIQASDSWEVVISPAMIAELRRIVSVKAKNTPAVIRAVDRYFSATLIETPTTAIEVCRDKNDDMVINCALSAAAALLISSDNDLLELNRSLSVHGLEIINVAEAYTRFCYWRGSRRASITGTAPSAPHSAC